MNYRVISGKKWREVQQSVEEFLNAEGPLKSESRLNGSIDDETFFVAQTSSKPKRERESVPRICLKMLTMNNLTATKLPITLFSAKRK